MARGILWDGRLAFGNTASGGAFAFEGPTIFGGQAIVRTQFMLHLYVTEFGDNDALPLSNRSLTIGAILGTGTITVPALDPETNPGANEWLGIWKLPMRVTPRSRNAAINAWDLGWATERTEETTRRAIAPGAAQRLWLKTSTTDSPVGTGGGVYNFNVTIRTMVLGP
jgi:hypothetical protein